MAAHAVYFVALVQDVSSGALFSGGVLDMIGVKHTPVRPVRPGDLSDQAMKDARMAVDVDPQQLSEKQKEVLRRFTRGGGTLLTAPPGWRFPQQRSDQITLDKEDVEKIDQIWKDINSMTGRRNLGARLFNASSMLSDLRVSPSGRQLLLHLLNYSDYPVEAITVHLLGKFRKARLYQPEESSREMTVYEIEDGTGVEIDKVGVFATLVLE